VGEATCRTCPFWAADPGDREEPGIRRECRRNPPPPHGHDIAEEPVSDDDWAAFSVTASGNWCGEHPLRQRDRLAAVAMQGLLAAKFWECIGGNPTDRDRMLARRAYQFVDAMLAEGERNPQSNRKE
jgi:hypothetical protein